MRNIPTLTPLAYVALSLATGLCARASSVYATPYTFTTLSGIAGLTGLADGQGTAALFNSPTGIAVGPGGNIYVADYGNATVRRISSSGAVTTIAGSPGVTGSANGTGAAAQFGNLNGVAVDGSGNIYVSDSYFSTVRKISPGGVVTTFAGTAGSPGHLDGTGTAAQLNQPAGVAVDGSGNVFVSDSGNHTIRKITPAGVVTTLAGSPGTAGTADGTGSSARFSHPSAMASDAGGNLYVTDDSDTVRRITPAGVVTMVAGTTGVSGSADGSGTAAQFYHPGGVAVDAFGNLFVADSYNDTIRMITPSALVTTLAGRVGSEGSADGDGSGALFNGPIGIAVDASGNLFVADTYNDTIREGSAAPPNSAPPRLINISTRAQVGTGGNILIPGFVIAGPGLETLLIRADGPSLGEFNVTGLLSAPSLTVFDSSQRVLATNTGWGNAGTSPQLAAAARAVGAFPLGDNTTDCALIITLPAGAYTVEVAGVGGATGVALAEVYEMASTGTRLVNISTRAQVGTGNAFLIPGFVISGSGTEHLLLRADGPSLSQFSVTGVLALPVLRVVDNAQNAFAADTGWSTNLNAAEIASEGAVVGAFALAPNSGDSATIVTLSPGAYTMQVSGVNNSTGVALAEVYELP